MADLMQQNQKLTRGVNGHCQQRHSEEHGQNSKNGEVENDVEEGDQSKGTVTHRVPHLEREMDQMKRAMEEMKDSMRRANHVEDLVHKTDSPFIAFITSHPLPSKFKMPTLDSYNGTQDFLWSYCHIQDNHASSRCSRQNYVQSLSYHVKRPSQSMVW